MIKYSLTTLFLVHVYIYLLTAHSVTGDVMHLNCSFYGFPFRESRRYGTDGQTDGQGTTLSL